MLTRFCKRLQQQIGPEGPLGNINMTDILWLGALLGLFLLTLAYVRLCDEA